MGGTDTVREEMRDVYRFLVGKPEETRPLGRPKGRYVDNIRLDLAEIGWEGVDYIHLVNVRYYWRALRNTVMKIWVHKCGEFLG